MKRTRFTHEQIIGILAEHEAGQLEQRGYDAEKLADVRHLVDAPDSELFDVRAYIRFTTLPKTRADRAHSVRKDSLANTEGAMRDFLLGVLKANEHVGETELTARRQGDLLTARYGSLADVKAALGNVAAIKQASFRQSAARSLS